jgi:FMN phosphatase YigB (HAD superfamily)
VGDSLEEDVIGAQAAGFQAVLLRRGQAHSPGAIESLTFLAGLCEMETWTSS